MNCSMPGSSALHYLLEFAQIHVYWVSDALQPSYPLTCPRFPSCPQSFPASRSFPVSQLSASGGQSIGVSASTSVPPMNTQDWSPRSVNERTLIYFLKKQKNKKTPKKPNFQILDVFDIQPLSSPFPAFNRSQHQSLFKWVSSSHQVAKVLEFQLQHQSFQWTFRTDFL